MGFGSFVGAVVGFTLGGPPGAALGAAAANTDAGKKALGAAGDAAQAAAEIAVEAVTGLGEVVYKGADFVVNAIDDASGSLARIVHGTIALRSLRQSEIAVLNPVFGRSVPYHRIVVSSLEGFSNRPLTLPGSLIQTFSWAIPGVGPLLGVYSFLRNLPDKYVLLMGPQGYNNGLDHPFDNVRGGQTLVHETAHVWQGYNGAFSWNYVVDSIVNQCKCGITGDDPYNATEGRQWGEYTAEQQARFVERWYTGEGSLRRRSGSVIPNAASMAIFQAYMDRIIRPGMPNAVINLPSAAGVGNTSSALVTSGAAVGANPLLGPQPQALTQVQRDAFYAQANALQQQAKMFRAMGQVLQATMMEQQAAQLMVLSGRRISATSTFTTSPLLRR